MKGFIIKEFYHIFRDARSMIILFGMPLVQVLLFGFAISNDIKNANIAILDHSKDYASREITQKLLSSGYFVLSAELSSEKEIGACFRKGKVKEVIIFGSDFALNLEKEKKGNIQIIADASDPNTANLLVNYTTSILNDYQRDLLKDKHLPLQIEPEVKLLYNPSLKSVFMFVPGIITILCCFGRRFDAYVWQRTYCKNHGQTRITRR